jgi:hypothetical protein
MTDTDRPQSDDTNESAPADADAASGGGAGSAPTPGRNRRAVIAIGIAVVAIIVAGGVLSSTVGLGPAWRSLVVALSPGPPPKVLVWRDSRGMTRRAAIDPVKYEALVAQEQKTLHAALIETRAAARTRIEADTAAVFSDIEDRVPQYGEWYYRYTTKYLLMTHGAMGFWRDFWNRPDDKPFALAEAIELIQDHLTGYLEQQYADKVLHPPDTEAKLQAAYDRDFAMLRAEWETIVGDEKQRFAKFLEAQNGTVVPPGESAALDDEKLDWNFAAGAPVHKDSVTVRKFRRGLLTIAISRPSKYITPGTPTPEPGEDPTEGTDEISHVISNLFSAVIDPLASQLSALLAGTVAGGFAGSITGGLMTVPVAATPGLVLSAPLVGAAIGAAITVGTDITSTRLEERMTRAAFEQSLRDTLEKTKKEITDDLVAALNEHVDAQFIDGSRYLGPLATVDKKPGASVPPG